MSNPDIQQEIKAIYDMAQRFEGGPPSGLLIKAGDTIFAMHMKITSLEKRLESGGALIQYAQHTRTCEESDTCTCGYDEALKLWEEGRK